jgi:hypothetical protein
VGAGHGNSAYSWEVFWRFGKLGKFGSYGPAGNNFGKQIKLQLLAGMLHIEEKNPVYSEFAYDRHRNAIAVTIHALCAFQTALP